MNAHKGLITSKSESSGDHTPTLLPTTPLSSIRSTPGAHGSNIIKALGDKLRPVAKAGTKTRNIFSYNVDRITFLKGIYFRNFKNTVEFH